MHAQIQGRLCDVTETFDGWRIPQRGWNAVKAEMGKDHQETLVLVADCLRKLQETLVLLPDCLRKLKHIYRRKNGVDLLYNDNLSGIHLGK